MFYFTTGLVENEHALEDEEKITKLMSGVSALIWQENDMYISCIFPIKSFKA